MSALRLAFLLCTALWLATLARAQNSAPELVTLIDGAPHRLVAVTNGQLFVDHEGRRVRAPSDAAWSLVGDPAAIFPLADWSPRQFTRRSPKPDRLYPPGGAWAGLVIINHRQGIDPNGKPTRSPFLALWPGALQAEGVVVVAWLIDGQPASLRLNPYRARTDGFFSIREEFEIPPPDRPGQAIVFVWQAGAWITPTPHFSSPTAEAALRAARRDDVASLAPLLAAEPALLRAADYRDDTLLHHAASAGALQTVRLLLAQGASPGARGYANRTPLHAAAAQGSAAVIDALLAAKAPPDPVDADGRTPLSFAADRGHGGAAAALAALRAVRPERPDDEGSTPLRLALSRGHADIARLLLERAPRAIDFKDEQTARVLASLAARGRTAGVKLLLEKGVPPDTTVRGTHALLEAARHDDPELVDALLAAGARPDQASPEGITPLLIAARAGHARIVQRLLDAGASPAHRTADGRLPLHFAVLGDDPATVSALLALDPAAALAESPGQPSPLALALILRSHQVLPLLERHVGDGPWLPAAPEQRAPYHHYAFLVAITNDRAPLVRSALAHGWPADTLFAGWPALRLARLYGATESAALLTAAGATYSDDLPFPLAAARELDERVAPLSTTRPDDPRDADEDFPAAQVTVEFLLGADGDVLFPRILASPDKRLSFAVLSALPEWRFTPPRRDGRAVATRVVLPLSFASSAERAYTAAQLDELPRVLRQISPVYPIAQRRDGGEGSVILGFEVSPEGQVENITVRESNHPAFEEPAIAALKQWLFTPGRRDGQPVRVRLALPLTFNLNN